MFELDKKWTVDGSTRRNLARYANHSCRPNAEADVIKGKVIIRAIKAIQPDVEPRKPREVVPNDGSSNARWPGSAAAVASRATSSTTAEPSRPSSASP